MQLELNFEKNVLTIKVIKPSLRDVSNLSKFFEHSKIAFGTSENALLLISLDKFNFLKRMMPKSQFDYIESSEIGTLLLNSKYFDIEESENEIKSPIVKVEKKGDEDE